MPDNPTDRKYSADHQWVKLEGGAGTVGITQFAQEQLTDVVFVELPEVGRSVSAGDPVAVLESVKSVADVMAPVGGEVTEVNTALGDHPEMVNDDPYGEGWIFKLKVTGDPPDSLMDAAAYETFLTEQD